MAQRNSPLVQSGSRWFSVRLPSPDSLGAALATSLLDPLGVYIALLCVQLPPWEAVLTCGLSCVQASIVLKPGIQVRALALAGASVWAAPPWYSIVFVVVDSVRVMQHRHAVIYSELVLTTLCAAALTMLCGAAADWLSTFIGFCTTVLGLWSLPSTYSLYGQVKLKRGRIFLMPLALVTWALGSPFSDSVHYVGFILVLLHAWYRDKSISEFVGPKM